MGKALSDYDTIVRALIQDRANKLTPDDRREAIQQAVHEHSRIKPVLRYRQVFGTGTARINTPTGWDDDLSTVQRIEYPTGDTPPTYLANDRWLIVNSTATATAYQILFLDALPGTAHAINLEWTVPHTVDEASGTIPDGHYRAVATLGAAYACLQLAGFYAQSGDPTIQVDSQDPMSKSQEYRHLAKDYENKYRAFFGLSPLGSKDETAVAAAGVFQDVDRHTGWLGSPFFHPHRWH